jgi:tRNA(Arg) A34 adenosine deaminase TadA
MRLTKPNEFFYEAKRIAYKSNMRHRHGCVIVFADKEIISSGYNYVNEYNTKFISIHAEVSAIKKLKPKYKNKDYLDKCALYVVRIGPDSLDNPYKMSVPCYNCTKYIHSSGIPRIYFSLTEDTVGMVYIPRTIKPTIEHITEDYDQVPCNYFEKCSRKYMSKPIKNTHNHYNTNAKYNTNNIYNNIVIYNSKDS